MGPEFFQTGMGRKFFEHDVPAIAKALQDVAVELRESNESENQKLMDLWNDDHAQFARLLAELKGVGLTAEQTSLLRLSMDCDTETICDILDRAEVAFERTKGPDRNG